MLQALADLGGWISDNSGWLGLVLSVVGFAITILQIRRSASAATAASEAADAAVSLVRHHQLVSSASRLQTIARDLDEAVTAGKEGLVVVGLLNDWRDEAMRIIGVLGATTTRDPNAPDLSDVYTALGQAAAAIEDLVEHAKDVVVATREARRAMRKAIEPIVIMGVGVATGARGRDE